MLAALQRIINQAFVGFYDVSTPPRQRSRPQRRMCVISDHKCVINRPAFVRNQQQRRHISPLANTTAEQHPERG